MRTQGNAVKRTTVAAEAIEQVLKLRRVYDAQKKRLEMAENALLEVEEEIIALIRSGATVISPYDVRLKSVERRNVAWKSVCAEVIGAEATEAILAETTPSISYRLLVKDAA